jgi:hypothetical protein
VLNKAPCPEDGEVAFLTLALNGMVSIKPGHFISGVTALDMLWVEGWMNPSAAWIWWEIKTLS